MINFGHSEIKRSGFCDCALYVQNILQGAFGDMGAVLHQFFRWGVLEDCRQMQEPY